jgi:prolipoprotein diacylglyceryltransferase
MLPVLNIGPLALPTPELILLAGFWLALEMTERQAPRFRVDPAHVYNLILAAILAGLVGARLVYAARSPAAFVESPLNMLALQTQMLDGTGGWAAALLAALIYIRVKRLAFWPALDSLTTLLSMLAVAAGLAHFASGDAFGAPADVPWAIGLWGAQRHPSQVYETLAALLVATAVWPGGRISLRSEKLGNGFRFWAFLGLSAAARLFLETFRGDSILLFGSFRQAQVVAWVVLALSLWQLGRRLSLLIAAPSAQEQEPE